jgi:hypothetical protein
MHQNRTFDKRPSKHQLFHLGPALIIGVAFVCLSSQSLPQTRPESKLNQISGQPELEIGAVRVSLGMSQEQAQSKFSEFGYKIENGVAPDTWIIHAGDRYGQVTFRSGRLVYASREWAASDEDGLRSVLNALTTFVQEGATSCSVSNHSFVSPGTAVDSVFISCGDRDLHLLNGNAQGSAVKHVLESIGAL